MRMPTHDEIAVRAYDLYHERGGVDGSDLNDWLRAEQELLDRPVEETRVVKTRNGTRRHTTVPDLAGK